MLYIMQATHWDPKHYLNILNVRRNSVTIKKKEIICQRIFLDFYFHIRMNLKKWKIKPINDNKIYEEIMLVKIKIYNMIYIILKWISNNKWSMGKFLISVCEYIMLNLVSYILSNKIQLLTIFIARFLN